MRRWPHADSCCRATKAHRQTTSCPAFPTLQSVGDEATLKFHFPINFNAVHNEFIRKSDGQPRLFIVVSALQVFYLLLGEARRGRRGERKTNCRGGREWHGPWWLKYGGGRKANRNRKVRRGISVIHSIVNLIEPREIRSAWSRKKNLETRDIIEDRNGWKINMICRSLLIKLRWKFNWLKAALLRGGRGECVYVERFMLLV